MFLQPYGKSWSLKSTYCLPASPIRVSVSGLLAALCVIITVEFFIPNADGSHVTSRSRSPPATTVSPVAIVVNATAKSALLLVTLETTKAPPPEFAPTVN